MGPIALSSVLDELSANRSPLVRSRRNGAWNAQDARFGSEVLGLAAALSGYGLRAGACAAVLGSEGYGTLCAGLAVIAAGATLVPLDPALSDDVLRRVLATTGAVHAIASDERQLARILALRPELAALELVLLMSAERSDRRPVALLAETAIDVGAASLVWDPDRLRRALAEGERGTACRVVDAAGEVRPVGRAVLLAAADVIAQAVGIAKQKAVLVALPVGSVERLGAALAVLGRGGTLLLPDPSERPDAGLEQHAADAILLNVSGLTRLHRAWSEDIEAKSWIGRSITRWALRQAVLPSRGWKHGVAEKFALRGLREKLGGRAAALDVIAGRGRNVSPEVDAFFSATGLAVRYLAPEMPAELAR